MLDALQPDNLAFCIAGIVHAIYIIGAHPRASRGI